MKFSFNDNFKYMKSAYFYIILFLLASCANIQPPQGGPEDKTPPKIVSYSPESLTRNFNKDYIEIEFSEYVNKNKVMENIFISPELELEFDFSGKTLEIEFKEELEKETTYALTIGADYTDLRGNNPEQSFALVFSTGSKIDTGSFSGRLLDKTPAGKGIFLYKISNINPDTLNPLTTGPDYRTVCGSTGIFRFLALSPGTYRCFAIDDKRKDNIYSQSVDDFGAAQSDIELVDGTAQPIRLRIGPPFDSEGPQLFNAEQISDNIISAKFSEEIDTTSITPDAFILSDSSQTQRINILSAFLKHEESKEVYLISENLIDSAKSYRIEINAENPILDIAGNAISDTAKVVYFTANGAKNEILPEVISTNIKDSSQAIKLDFIFEYIFTLPIDSTSISNAMDFKNLTDSTDIIPNFIMNGANILRIIPYEKLKSKTWYNISLNLNNLKLYNGNSFKDTTISIDFLTADTRSYGTLSGRIKEYNSENIIIIARHADNRTVFKTKADENGNWKIEDIPSSSYSIEAFIDADNNGEYSYGSPYPWLSSEKFTFYPKPVKLALRWEVKDIIIDFTKQQPIQPNSQE